MSGKAKDILGSDLKISGEKMTKEIESRVEGVISAMKSTSLINTFSMGRAGSSSRLVLVNQQQEGFPFMDLYSSKVKKDKRFNS